jgi:hypothetical protein
MYTTLKAMREYILFAVLIILVSISCGRNNPEFSGQTLEVNDSLNEKGTAEIEFRTTRYDFGNVSHGEKLAYTFIYKNTGDIPLVIYSARADCGCTVPEYDDKPLAPGQEGNLKAVFNTQGFRGYQTKTIQVTTNAGMQTLALRAVIE